MKTQTVKQSDAHLSRQNKAASIKRLKELIERDSKRPVKTWYWNKAFKPSMGGKKKDFEGTIGDLLKKWDCKVKVVQHPSQNDVYGFQFKAGIGTSVLCFDTFGNANSFELAFLDALKLFLTYLGDKAIISTSIREIRINH